MTATATATNAAAGTPIGSVEFSVNGADVGTAPLDATGTATLAYVVPTGDSRHVAAAYFGSADFTGSVASTNRTDPTIAAILTSTTPRTAQGWYSGPVSIRFTCGAGSADLAAPCPAPVTIATSGAGQSVTWIITTTDGGAAAATVTRLNIDTSAPSVRLRGARNRALYRGTAPRPTCAATDALSGAGPCEIRVATGRNGLTRYAGTATNGAGLTTTIRDRYRVLKMWLKRVPRHNGQFDVRTRHTVTLVVASRKRPHYEWAAPATTRPGSPRPRGGHTAFFPKSNGRWQVRVTLTRGMAQRHKHWNLGARVGDRLRTIRIAFND